ncbi:MAG: DOMON-like domain-containing protein [Brevundimonas sp.]|uniref:DOMON-like domain-containing protein n=1 Tax=Brevundimonas sp. TaxID=1871086 RepID=UPI00121214F8|nr:DOMON-like domain-containing protein [Brevundimonas sp.]RZJ17104.1 MAG: DOMON-like domain-containing protein [Brevundimonas sp.]
MRATLIPHPTTADGPSVRIEADLDQEGRSWAFVKFRLSGAASSVRIPQRLQQLDKASQEAAETFASTRSPDLMLMEAGRTDGLWKHTCFEVFARLSDGSYAEFNISPSGEWASYGFEGYRDGMQNLGGVRIQRLGDVTGDAIEVEAILDWPGWPHVTGIGLSAVIEDVDGNISYWALAHPSDKPDFHHPDSFVLELP